MNNIYLFAATETDADGGLLGSLGIDIPTLIFQIIAFLLLVAVLAKWVFPILINVVDKRQEEIQASSKAAESAQKKAAEAEAEVAKLLKQARAEASEIVSVAKDEAAAAVTAAESKAKARADTIVANAQDQIEKDVIAAKNALRNETVDLIALATEKVVGKVVSADVDTTLINQSLKEVR